MVDLTLDVDKTFNPGGGDPRELGIRVFHTYIDPGAASGSGPPRVAPSRLGSDPRSHVCRQPSTLDRCVPASTVDTQCPERSTVVFLDTQPTEC